MWGIFAAICGVVALVINLLVKDADVKYATDFLYLGLVFVGLALAFGVGPWWPSHRS
jgi:hypothetical protein